MSYRLVCLISTEVVVLFRLYYCKEERIMMYVVLACTMKEQFNLLFVRIIVLNGKTILRVKVSILSSHKPRLNKLLQRCLHFGLSTVITGAWLMCSVWLDI